VKEKARRIVKEKASREVARAQRKKQAKAQMAQQHVVEALLHTLATELFQQGCSPYQRAWEMAVDVYSRDPPPGTPSCTPLEHVQAMVAQLQLQQREQQETPWQQQQREQREAQWQQQADLAPCQIPLAEMRGPFLIKDNKKDTAHTKILKSSGRLSR
jgi:hypothetical protein